MSDAHAPRPTTAPAPSPASQELLEESRVGGSEAARAINLCLLALSRTARAFTLYDARNQAVGEFLTDLDTKLKRALAAVGGALNLEIRGYEVAWNGDVVYVEKERERSLAFRLYRDGVRRLGFAPALAWDEVLGLVEILSVRYTGVRQQEDDLVTLLSKAAFKNISFAAVEGFSEEGQDEESRKDAAAQLVEPPADWDLPLPALGAPVAAGLRRLPAEALTALAAEAAEASAACECVELVLDLLDCLSDERDPLEADDVEPLVFEVRDFLIQEGEFGALRRLIPALERCGAGDLRPQASILARFGGPGPLTRIAQRLRGTGSLPEELLRYLEAVPGDHLADALGLLGAERDATLRAVYTELVATLGHERPRLLTDRLATADGPLARDLFAALSVAAPQQALEAALQLKDRPDAELQLAVVKVLSESVDQAPVARALLGLLAAPDERVRTAAVAALSASRDTRVFDALARHLQERAQHGLDTDEAEALGAVLAGLNPEAAYRLFSEWLHPRTFLQRVVESPSQRLLHWTAVSGLGRLAGEEAEKLLRWFLGRSSGDLHQLCLAVLVQRRREQRQKGVGQHDG